MARTYRDLERDLTAARSELRRLGCLHQPFDGAACHRCGRCDGLDAVVPDLVWEQLSAAAGGVNLLCLWCMDKLAYQLGITCTARLHFAGAALVGSSQSDADLEQISKATDAREEALQRLAALEARRDQSLGNSAPDFVPDELGRSVLRAWHGDHGAKAFPMLNWVWATRLHEAGFRSALEVARASDSALGRVYMVGPARARQLRDRVMGWLQRQRA